MFRPRAIALLLVLITMLADLPTLQNQFLGFDDETYVSQNTNVQDGLTGASLEWAFTSFYASNWHPLTWITIMVDYQLFRLNPAGHHFINILFHSANVGLLFVLLLRLTGRLWPGAFAAALFAWHPLHVESVAWIAELKDVSSTFWGLLAMLAYVHYAKNLPDHARVVPDGEGDPGGEPTFSGTRHPVRFYWLSLALFAMSLMCKSMLVTLPFVLLLLDYWPLQRVKNAGRCLIEKLPFLLLVAGVSVLTILAQRNTAMASFSIVPFQLRLENAITAYAGYLWKAVWPAGLTILYPLPDHVLPVKLALSVLTLVVVSGIAVWGVRRQPWLLVGWLWYLGTLVPVIGLIQVGSQAMADRYTYFPLIGVFFAGALSVAAAARRFQIPPALLAVPAVLILAACLTQTELQLRYWRNTQTLFTHALEHTTANPLAHLVLGDAYQDANELDKAMVEYQKSLKLSDSQPKTYESIGRLLATEGKFEPALGYYRQALKLKPKSPVLHDRIGTVLIQLKRYQEAAKEFAEAIRLDPAYAPAHFRMGWILLAQDRGSEAAGQFREAVKLDPDNLQMLIYVARVMAAAENPEVRNGAEACDLARRAGELTTGNQPGVLDTLAAAYAESGRFEEAVAAEQQALALAQKAGSNEDEPAMQDRLKLYREHQPWRKSFKAP